MKPDGVASALRARYASAVRNDKRREWNGFFASALILAFSPGEKEQLLFVSVLLADCPANPVARIFKETANNSPSPGGEGRGEDRC